MVGGRHKYDKFFGFDELQMQRHHTFSLMRSIAKMDGSAVQVPIQKFRKRMMFYTHCIIVLSVFLTIRIDY